MSLRLLVFFLFNLVRQLPVEARTSFSFTALQKANLTFDGIAHLTPNGLLQLVNTTGLVFGHAFYPSPIRFKSSSSGSAFSFSTHFVFGIIHEDPLLAAGEGMAFVMSPTRSLPGRSGGGFLGMFNQANNQNFTNHVIAVELDTYRTSWVNDTDNNHVGIDINGANSSISSHAGYFDRRGSFHNLTLASGKPMQVWVEYDGVTNQIDVTLAPIHPASKPNTPLLSFPYDLSPILKETMFVGFSASTGPSVVSNHYVLGWSFMTNGPAPDLDLSRLPKLPRLGPKERSKFLTTYLPVICVLLFLSAILGLVYYVRRLIKFAELLEDWELEYGPHRFKYKDLYKATKGFKEKELLGKGGFGRVYKGVLPKSKIQVAIKRVSHDSRQGMKEFVAEIVSLGRLRHRNLVPLLGYCRRKGEMLLVYEFMPNGSLDQFLFSQSCSPLNWSQRFRIIKGVATGLLYLHEEWEQVVIHRDVKASNILLDVDLNGKLGDFGLARLYDHGTEPETTHVVGTLGYLAPEHSKTGKVTTKTDVYSFGQFLLEVVTGKRPIDPKMSASDMVLLDWVFQCWQNGDILQVVDPNLGSDYDMAEVEMVLKLGLMCSNSEPMARPTMRQIVMYFEGDTDLPESVSLSIEIEDSKSEGFDNYIMSLSSSMGNTASVSATVLSGGR